jgi:hypothetical protein
MRSSPPSQGQLILFPGAGAAPPAGRAPRRQGRPGPAARKAAQLDRLAQAAERELAEAWRSGDMIAVRDAHERARGARRAAELLRAGPRGVAAVIGGEPEAA